MAKYGVELSIDVTKIEKARIFEGKKGKYLTMTVFVDTDNKDQFDNNGMITHKKLEGEERAPILGNCKVFWSDNAAPAPQQPQQQQYAPQQQPARQPAPANYQPQMPAPTQQQPTSFDDFDDDIPFN
jgi:hypothetical protein